MNPKKRIVLNIFAQYFRAVISAIISLYTMRIVLGALGKSDFGIYSVISGVVALLSFITNALIITTQRYISFYSGMDDAEYLRKLFSNSLFLHLCIGLVLATLLFSIQPLFFDFLLNIEPSRIETAGKIYLLTVIMLFLTIIIAPFKAVLIAHENIVYISIVEVADALLKLLLVLSMLQIKADTLLVYGYMMLIIQGFNMFAYSCYTLKKFPECHVKGVLRQIDRSILLNLSSFAGWTTYSMGCVVGRTQGLAIVFNHFYGTVINAAYGIANQVYSSVVVVSSSILNAMNPQIMKAEGEKDRKKMLHLAEQESKYSEMLVMLILIPLIFEMPSILQAWLGQVDDLMIMFTRFVLLAFMCDQITYGLNTVNQALGNLRNYSLLMYTPKLLISPVAYVLLYIGYDVFMTMCLYLIVEIFVSMMRLPYIKYTAGISISNFIRSVFLPLLPLLCCQLVVCWLCVKYVNIDYRFLFTIFMSLICGLFIVYYVVFTATERTAFVNTIRKR